MPPTSRSLQRRFGWLLANLTFTTSHACQYAPDALSSVFILDTVLAAIGTHWSTSLPVASRVLYDLVSFLGAAYG